MKAFRIVCVFCGFTFFLHCPQLSHSDIPDDKENREPVPRLYQWDRTALHHRLGFGSKGSAGPDAREEASHGSYYRCVGRQCLLLNVCVLQDRRNADRYQMVFFQSDRPAQLHFEFATDGTDMLNAYLLSKLRRSTWFARTGVSQLADWSIHVESEVGSMPTFHHRTDHDRNPGLVHVLVPGDSLFFAGHTLLSDGFAVFHSMVAFNLLGAEAQILLPRSVCTACSGFQMLSTLFGRDPLIITDLISNNATSGFDRLLTGMPLSAYDSSVSLRFRTHQGAYLSLFSSWISTRQGTSRRDIKAATTSMLPRPSSLLLSSNTPMRSCRSCRALMAQIKAHFPLIEVSHSSFQDGDMARWGRTLQDVDVFVATCGGAVIPAILLPRHAQIVIISPEERGERREDGGETGGGGGDGRRDLLGSRCYEDIALLSSCAHLGVHHVAAKIAEVLPGNPFGLLRSEVDALLSSFSSDDLEFAEERAVERLIASGPRTAEHMSAYYEAHARAEWEDSIPAVMHAVQAAVARAREERGASRESGASGDRGEGTAGEDSAPAALRAEPRHRASGTRAGAGAMAGARAGAGLGGQEQAKGARRHEPESGAGDGGVGVGREGRRLSSHACTSADLVQCTFSHVCLSADDEGEVSLHYKLLRNASNGQQSQAVLPPAMLLVGGRPEEATRLAVELQYLGEGADAAENATGETEEDAWLMMEVTVADNAGHTLNEDVFCAFHLMLNTHSLSFHHSVLLLTACGQQPPPYPLFTALCSRFELQFAAITRAPIHRLSHVVSGTRPRVCFRTLLVGAGECSYASQRFPGPFMGAHFLLFQRFAAVSLGLKPLDARSQPAIVTVGIKPEREVMGLTTGLRKAALRAEFGGGTVQWQHVPFAEQVQLMRETSVFLSTIGTTVVPALFLPPGAALLLFAQPLLFNTSTYAHGPAGDTCADWAHLHVEFFPADAGSLIFSEPLSVGEKCLVFGGVWCPAGFLDSDNNLAAGQRIDQEELDEVWHNKLRYAGRVVDPDQVAEAVLRLLAISARLQSHYPPDRGCGCNEEEHVCSLQSSADEWLQILIPASVQCTADGTNAHSHQQARCSDAALDGDAVSAAVDWFLEATDMECASMLHLGGSREEDGFGAYVLCADTLEQGHRGELTAVTIGVGCRDELDDLFERDLAHLLAEHSPGSFHVHAFGIEPCPGEVASGISYYQATLGGEDRAASGDLPPALTLRSALTLANVSRVDVLKIDCEGCEWAMFRHIREHDPTLLRDLGVSISVMELHLGGQDWECTAQDFLSLYETMQVSGFGLYQREVNTGSVGANASFLVQAWRQGRTEAAASLLIANEHTQHQEALACCLNLGFMTKPAGKTGEKDEVSTALPVAPKPEHETCDLLLTP